MSRAIKSGSTKNLAPLPARTRRNSSFAPGSGIASPSLITNHHSLITNNYPQITAFLIDTLPIRIARKSFACIIGTRSNRHSSEALFAPFWKGNGTSKFYRIRTAPSDRLRKVLPRPTRQHSTPYDKIWLL